MQSQPTENRFAYPAGSAPGFDPSHPASQGCLASAAHIGSSPILIQSGKPPTNTAVNYFQTIDGIMGPAVNISGGYNYWSTVPQISSVSVITLAAMFRWTSDGSERTIVGYGGGGNVYLDVTSAGTVKIVMGSIPVTGINLTSGVPYFVAASITLSLWSVVVTNLLTGKIQSATGTTAGTAQTTTSGTFALGANFGGLRGNGNYACGMVSNSYMSVNQLLAWGSAPWEFWYPNK